MPLSLDYRTWLHQRHSELCLLGAPALVTVVAWLKWASDPPRGPTNRCRSYWATGGSIIGEGLASRPLTSRSRMATSGQLGLLDGWWAAQASEGSIPHRPKLSGCSRSRPRVDRVSDAGSSPRPRPRLDVSATSVLLDTNGSDPALALFRRAGYQETDDFNGNELARFWFRKELGKLTVASR